MHLLEQFRANGEAALERWIADGVAEDDNTEFKSGAIFDQSGNLTRNGRQSIGAEVSGMANSGGGTIFLGLQSQRVGSLDVASALVPVPVVERALGNLKALLENLVQPHVEGMEFDLAYGSCDERQGYIALTVPRSDKRPHMCRAPELHSYFKRSGSSALVMSAYEVEDQLLRVRKAQLRGRMEFQSSGSIGLTRTSVGFLILENVSEVSAQNCWAAVECEGMEFGGDEQRAFGFTVGPRVPKGRTFYAQGHILIPPSGTAAVCTYRLYLGKDVDGNIEPRQPSFPREPAVRRPEILIEYGCLNTKSQSFGRKFSDDELDDLYDSGKLMIA